MRAIFLFVAFFVSATSAAADRFTVTDLRKAVAARDFDLVNQSLDTAQSEFLAGERSADNMRALFIVLSRSAPETVQFVEDWLARDTDNPKAQIARAWSIYESAGHVQRGKNGYSAHIANHMRGEVVELASAAYQNAPYLLPTSDAVVRNVGMTSVGGIHPLEVMNGVLMAHPNWGTIVRAIQTGYLSGKSDSAMRKFCERAVSHFPKEETARLNHRCLMHLGSTYGGSDLQSYLEAYLWIDKSPETVMDRLSYFIQRFDLSMATRDQFDWAKETLMTMPADSYQMIFLYQLAKKLDNNMRFSGHKGQVIIRDFSKARLAEVEAFLVHDPLNPDLLDIAEDVAFMPEFEVVEITNNSTKWRAVPVHRTKEQKVAFHKAKMAHKYDFALRRIKATPYGTEGWFNFAQYASRHDLPDSLFSGDAAYENGVFFADDPASALATYIHQKRLHWETMLAFKEGATIKDPVWSSFFNRTDTDEMILCPFLRATLLHDAICETYPSGSAMCDAEAFPDPQPISILKAVATNTPACAGLINMNVKSLWYSATPLNEMEAGMDSPG